MKRQGREKLHFINPVPINDIAERWIGKFERPRLRRFRRSEESLLKEKVMSSAAGSTFVYVTYIRTTPEKLWAALTDPEFIKQYWFGMTLRERLQEGLAVEARVRATAASRTPARSWRPIRRKRLVIKWRNEWKPELEGRGLLDTATMETRSRCRRRREAHDHALDRQERTRSSSRRCPAAGRRSASNLKSLAQGSGRSRNTKAYFDLAASGASNGRLDASPTPTRSCPAAST